MRLLFAAVVMLALATPAQAAYLTGDPCVATQKTTATGGTVSTDPKRCPPSSIIHHFAAAFRRPEWIESPGSVGAAAAAPSMSSPSMGHGGGKK